MEGKKQRKITKREQKTAVEILSYFFYVSNMKEVVDNFNIVMGIFGLMEDPFTGFPCTPEEYVENKREYEKEVMMRRYGHCDGLD